MRKIIGFVVLLTLPLGTLGTMVPRTKATSTPSVMLLTGHGEVVRFLSLQLFSPTSPNGLIIYPNPLSTIPLVSMSFFPATAPNPWDFPVVFIIDPGWYGGSIFSATELSSLHSYILAGGTVVVTAEWGGGGTALTYPQTITNYMAGAAGVTSPTYVVPQTGVDFVATSVASHPFTVGVTIGGGAADYHYNDDETLALLLPSGWTSLIEGPQITGGPTAVSLLATLSIGNGRFVFANGELGDPDIYYNSGNEVGLITVLRNIVANSFLHAIDEEINEFADEINTAPIVGNGQTALTNQLGFVAAAKDVEDFPKAFQKMNTFMSILTGQSNIIPEPYYTTFVNKANTLLANLQTLANL